MIIKQLSVFMENRVGIITEVTSILSQHNINMTAFSVADGAEFGILRLIVSDIDKAVKILEDANLKVVASDVICLNIPNVAGGLATVLEILAKEDVFIEYMYAFSEGEVASTVIRPTNIERCAEILKQKSDELISINPQYKL